MKILLVNYRYFISGGPEKYMFNIKEMLEQEGHEVYPFSVHSDKNVPTEYDKYFVDPIGGRDAVYYDDYKKTPKTIMKLLSRSIYSFEVKKALKRMIADVKPDIVYIIHFVNKLSPSVISAAGEMHVPVVLRLSDYFMLCPRFDFLYDQKICEDCLMGKYGSCIKKKCVKGSIFASAVRVFSMKVHKAIKIYDKVDAFVTPSGFLKEKLMQSGIEEKKIHWIPTFYKGQPEQAVPAGQYGLYFGRISEEKGVEVLVKAYEKLGDNYQLKIAGDDSTALAVKLKQYVKDKKMHNVEFLGFRKGEALNECIRNSKYTFVPSICYDNLPNAALESFAFRKPVIASNLGSLPELITDGYNGLLFQTNDADDLAKRVRELDDKAVKQMGENACQVLKERYSEKLHYTKLMELFEEVIRKKK